MEPRALRVPPVLQGRKDPRELQEEQLPLGLEVPQVLPESQESQDPREGAGFRDKAPRDRREPLELLGSRVLQGVPVPLAPRDLREARKGTQDLQATKDSRAPPGIQEPRERKELRDNR